MSQEKYLMDIIPSEIYSTISAEKILNQLNRILKNHLYHTAYNSIGTFFQRLKHTPVDSYEIFQRYSSGNCIGLSLGLLQQIIATLGGTWENIMRLPPIYVIPATLPLHYQQGSSALGHVALLITCTDGFLLLDPAFHLPEVIFFKNTGGEEVSLKVGEKIWRFKLQSPEKKDDQFIPGKILASVETKRFGQESFEYKLQHISNPDHIILQSSFKEIKKISYVQRNKEGIQINHLIIDLQTYQIKLARRSEHPNSYHLITLDFREHSFAELQIELNRHGCPPAIMKQIEFIISATEPVPLQSHLLICP